MCAANPDECHVDRVSVMNEDDECPNYQCAEGHTGELCNSEYAHVSSAVHGLVLIT